MVVSPPNSFLWRIVLFSLVALISPRVVAGWWDEVSREGELRRDKRGQRVVCNGNGVVIRAVLKLGPYACRSRR